MTETTGGGAGQASQSALSSDLADVLIELSIALHKHAMYPEGHPSLGPACERVAQRLDPLLAERGTLSLGVASDQLVIEGVATDPKNPVLGDLAGRLHRHRLGAISFRRGADGYEIGRLLTVLAVEADRTGKPIGVGPAEELTAWPNVTLHPLTYDALQLIDEDPDEESSQGSAARTHAAQLWVGLARAAIASDSSAHDNSIDTEPSVVAQAIDDHEGESAYDQVIVGYLLKIAEELRTTHGTEAAGLRKRMSKLVSSLGSSTVDRLLEMGGDRVQRRKFLLNASEGMAVDAVLELVQSAAESHEQTISHSMLRMLQKLAQHTETGRSEKRAAAEASVRDQIGQLIRGWSLKDPNPGAYGEALEALASSGPMYSVAPDRRYLPEPKRMLQMALEVDAFGEPIQRAVETLVEEGNARWVVQTLIEADAPEAVSSAWGFLCSPERVAEVIQAETIDTEVLDALLAGVGEDAIEVMLDVLAESDSRQTRRILLDRIVRLGPSVGPLAMKRLQDSRWFVVRNTLSIIGVLPDPPADFDPTVFLQHEDARVRREAIGITLKNPAFRERAVCVALADTDSRNVRVGLAAARESCPASAVSLVVQKALSRIEEVQRIVAIHVLADCGHAGALDGLIQLTAPRKTLLGTKLPQKTKVFLAALSALGNYREDPRAEQILAMAAKSRDADVAAAAAGEGKSQ